MKLSSFQFHKNQLDLVVLAQTNLKARNKFIEQNMNLVYSVANKFAKYNNFKNCDDLIQEGVLGLIKAIGKFNPKKSPVFGAYAKLWISAYISRELWMSRQIVPRMTSYRYAKSRPIDQGLSDLDSEQLRQEGYNQEELYEQKEFGIWFNKTAKSLLSTKELNIFNAYTVFNDGDTTLRDIATKEKLSQEGVRKINLRALKKIKDNLYESRSG